MKIALKTMEPYGHHKNETLQFGWGNKSTLRVQFCFIICIVCLVMVYCIAINSSAPHSYARDLQGFNSLQFYQNNRKTTTTAK